MALSPMALKKILILRRPLRGRLEGPRAPIRRPLIPAPPVIPAKKRVTEFNRAGSHLAPLVGRARKLRIARLPGEGQLPPHLQAPCNRKGPVTPALSHTLPSPASGGGSGWGQTGRGSIPWLRPVYAAGHAASRNTGPFPVIPAPPVIPAQAGTQSLPLAGTGGPQSRPVAPSARSLRPDERSTKITHGSDPQTRQEN
jgi:hypothetical protein